MPVCSLIFVWYASIVLVAKVMVFVHTIAYSLMVVRIQDSEQNKVFVHIMLPVQTQ